MSEKTGTAVKVEDVDGNAVRLIDDEFWRQDVEPWCEPVDDGGDRAAAGDAGGPVHF